jgi:putative hemolysin
LSLATYLLVILACLVLSAIFSGSETALLRLRAEEIEEEVEESKKPSAVAVRELVSSTSRLLVTILLGNNVVNILAASVASALAVVYLGPKLGIPVATVIMTVLVLVFCEVLPKAVAAAHPRGVARVVGLPLYLLHQILRPVHAVFDRVIEPAVRRVAGSREGGLPRTSEEVLRLARKVADEAGDEGTPLAIIGATSKAAEMTVEEIMVPRTEIVAFPVEQEPSDLLEKVMEDRYTRVPIYAESIDDVLGIVHLPEGPDHAAARPQRERPGRAPHPQARPPGARAQGDPAAADRHAARIRVLPRRDREGRVRCHARHGHPGGHPRRNRRRDPGRVRS